MLLELRGVTKRYGRITALDQVDLQLEDGSIGLLGPNGAGKSTLLKTLLGLVTPTRGTIEVLGFDAPSRPLALRQRVGYMPEDECMVAGLDAVETCTLAGELCGLPAGEARERAHGALAFVGLEDKRYQQVHTYSTGQKQRVKLAQAIIHDPDLLLLDEPTNGLDPRGREEMLALIQQLPESRGCSIILSSHLLPDVEAVCASAVLLSDGRTLFNGTIAGMQQSESGALEVRVKAGTDDLVRRLGDQGCEVDLVGEAITVRLPPGEDADLVFQSAREAGIQVRHLAPVRQSLEAAFVRIMQQQGGER